jgi:3-oxoadipate enol-lactonase
VLGDGGRRSLRPRDRGLGGAAVAVELAVRHPEDVLSVTTFGGAFLPVPEEDDPYLTALRSGQIDKAFLRRVVDASVASATPRAVRDRVYREMTENDPETAEAIWRAALATDARDSVEHVAAPALVVTGEVDASRPPGQAEWFARAVRGELRVLLGVGHLPMYEAPKLCASLLAEHVQATRNRERSMA